MKWQPIETAPKDGTQILVWDGSNMICVKWHEIPQQFAAWEFAHTNDHAHFVTRDVTHWRPLPEPPSEKST